MSDMVAECEDCRLLYAVSSVGEPITQRAYTCDDCGGYVDVVAGS